MDLSWNYAAESQAYDRAHRIGQNKPVFVKRLVVADTIEERYLHLSPFSAWVLTIWTLQHAETARCQGGPRRSGLGRRNW